MKQKIFKSNLGTLNAVASVKYENGNDLVYVHYFEPYEPLEEIDLNTHGLEIGDLQHQIESWAKAFDYVLWSY